MDHVVQLQYPAPVLQGVTLEEIYASIDALREITTRLENDPTPPTRPKDDVKRDITSVSVHLAKIRDYLIGALARMKISTNFPV